MWLKVIVLKGKVFSDKCLKAPIYGGSGEIRTHGRKIYTTFPRLHHRPLGHRTILFVFLIPRYKFSDALGTHSAFSSDIFSSKSLFQGFLKILHELFELTVEKSTQPFQGCTIGHSDTEPYYYFFLYQGIILVTHQGRTQLFQAIYSLQSPYFRGS